MKSFKPGDVVKVIAGPRAGEVTTVESELRPAIDMRWQPYRFPMIHRLGLRSMDAPQLNIYAPPAWLDHYYDGKEKSDITDWRELLPRVREEA